MLETAIISALVPAFVSGVKGLSERFIGLSVDDRIKMQAADTERLKALAELDKPIGNPSQWVVDLRASFRYIACGIFVVGGVSTLYFAPTLATWGLEAAIAASSFIFGERMVLSLQRK